MGARRRGDPDRRRARRLQHQQGMRLDRRRTRSARKVREMRADIGIALDGDADRVVIVDETRPAGRRRPADGGDRARAGRTTAGWPKPGVVATVMSNLGLERYLAGAGLVDSCARRSATATCSSRCASTATMSAASSPATSSCPITPRPATASSRRCRCSRVVKKQDRPVSRGLPPLRAAAAGAEERALSRRQAAGGREGARSAIEGAEQRLDGHGRLVIRPSGTEPVIRVMAEGDDRSPGRGSRRHDRFCIGEPGGGVKPQPEP